MQFTPPKILFLILDALSGGKYQLRCLHNAQDALLGHQQGFPAVGGRQVAKVPAQSLIREMDFRISVDSSAIIIKVKKCFFSVQLYNSHVQVYIMN